MDAAHELRDAKDYAATKKAVENLKTAMKNGRAAGGDLAWSKISPIDTLMNDEVSNVNTKLKNGLHRFEKRTKETAAHAAIMALIAENAKLYVGDNKKPGESRQVACLLQSVPRQRRRPGRQGPRRRQDRRQRGDGKAEPVLPRLPRRVQSGREREVAGTGLA